MDRERTVIFGAGGVAREVAWLLSEITPRCTIGAFAVPDRESAGHASIDGVAIMAESAIATLSAERIDAYLAIGLPGIRRKVHANLRSDSRFSFPTLVHPSASMDRREGRTTIAQGSIVYPLASLTTGVALGEFVQVNPCATIGHGARIGRYSTVCPGANISGEATIGEGCFIGAGAVIREGVRIADGCMIGAGAVVVQDIVEAGTWVGVPAKRLGA